ncbi:MAG: tRNA (cytidine(56)-2'-O)-methyltransferase [Candidatus Aenigmarchaeota archaeon]|nr:tRNA (cytidine(56)-2'-O)-methyltransferase [Candidatus Aenigmarchaeota archaeon]
MIDVLRIGHRPGRDPRISTHCALVARALGAERLIYTGTKDDIMEKNVRRIREQWGGKFEIMHANSWKRVLMGFSGISVHLTMYGLPLQKEIDKIRRAKNVIVVIGGGKVPMDVYHAVDYNIGVTNQPHSEVAALAVFLHEYFRGRELEKTFSNAKMKIVPQKCGKKFIP